MNDDVTVAHTTCATEKKKHQQKKNTTLNIAEATHLFFHRCLVQYQSSISYYSNTVYDVCLFVFTSTRSTPPSLF